jgi:hypothetical protein
VLPPMATTARDCGRLSPNRPEYHPPDWVFEQATIGGDLKECVVASKAEVVALPILPTRSQRSSSDPVGPTSPAHVRQEG